MPKSKFNFILSIFLLLELTYLQAGFSNKVIKQLANKLFINRSGYQILQKTQSSGKWFEMECGLRQELNRNDEVLGFSLSLRFPYREKLYGFIRQGEGEEPLSFELRDVEYDVVTHNFVIEAKKISTKSKRHEQYMRQFRKEYLLLLWIKEVYSSIRTKETSIVRSKKENRYCLIIKGPPTNNKEIAITSSWINTGDKAEYYNQWCNLIKLLAQTNFLVCFKNKAPPILTKILLTCELPIHFESEISFELPNGMKLTKSSIRRLSHQRKPKEQTL